MSETGTVVLPNVAFLGELSETHAVSGDESAIGLAFFREARKVLGSGGAAEFLTDAVGNYILRLSCGIADAPKVALLGHGDQIGFQAVALLEKGYVRAKQVGGWHAPNTLGHRFLIQTLDGGLRLCVSAGPAVHVMTPDERKKSPEIKDLAFDLIMPGLAKNGEAKEAAAKLVEVGALLAPQAQFVDGPDYVMGVAMDNRISVWNLVETLKLLLAKDLKVDVDLVVCAQEEVGTRGSATYLTREQPQIAIGLDVNVAADTPGVSPDRVINDFGHGISVTISDGRMIAHKGLNAIVFAAAEELDFPTQRAILELGSQDASAAMFTTGGTAATAFGPACRHIHSAGAECIAKKCLSQWPQLTASVVGKLHDFNPCPPVE